VCSRRKIGRKDLPKAPSGSQAEQKHDREDSPCCRGAIVEQSLDRRLYDGGIRNPEIGKPRMIAHFRLFLMSCRPCGNDTRTISGSQTDRPPRKLRIMAVALGLLSLRALPKRGHYPSSPHLWTGLWTSPVPATLRQGCEPYAIRLIPPSSASCGPRSYSGKIAEKPFLAICG
jgi:hypothetical protein